MIEDEFLTTLSTARRAKSSRGESLMQISFQTSMGTEFARRVMCSEGVYGKDGAEWRGGRLRYEGNGYRARCLHCIERLIRVFRSKESVDYFFFSQTNVSRGQSGSQRKS